MNEEASPALEPGIKRVVDAYNTSNPPVLGVESPRELRRVQRASFTPEPPLPKDAGTEVHLEVPRSQASGGPIPARLLLPPDPPSPPPLLVWFHGGGWVLGSAEEATKLCRKLMHHSKVAILNVDYRLAPEHPYPAAIEDCIHAVRWVAGHAATVGIDPDRIGVGGSSAGGNLAAACALAARDGRLPPLAMQCLLYPVLDAAFDTPSYRAFETGLVLERDSMIWFWDQYCPNLDQRAHWMAAPARASELQGLCPTHLVIAQQDVLRSENEAFAHRLRDAGVVCEVQLLEGAIHGALTMCPDLPTMERATETLCTHIRAQLGS